MKLLQILLCTFVLIGVIGSVVQASNPNDTTTIATTTASGATTYFSNNYGLSMVAFLIGSTFLTFAWL